MSRELEVALALLCIPISAFCLWDLSYFTGALASSVALAFSVGLYILSERKRA